MLEPALSPDGQRIVVTSTEGGSRDIWIHDLIRSTKTRLTFDEGAEQTPTWSPSGGEIAYTVGGFDGSSLMRKTVDGTGEAAVLVEADSFTSGADWSRDGRYLAYYELNPDTQSEDIRYVEFGADGDASEPVTFLSTPAEERAPKLSPDGRFLAYVSNESGRTEIYVQPFPDGAGKWQVSENGGSQPRWRSDGNRLYYVEGEDALMTVSISTEPAFTLGQPQVQFESRDLGSGLGAAYDVSADGQRFLTIVPVEGADAAPPKIRIVQNWYEEFRERGKD